MGQKVHPGGLRVGVIHDWKSNWYVGKKETPQYILEDVRIRDHINGKLGHAGLSDILIRKDKQRITVERGMFLKRFQARAKGRGNRVLKHTCHIYITVGD